MHLESIIFIFTWSGTMFAGTGAKDMHHGDPMPDNTLVAIRFTSEAEFNGVRPNKLFFGIEEDIMTVKCELHNISSGASLMQYAADNAEAILPPVLEIFNRTQLWKFNFTASIPLRHWALAISRNDIGLDLSGQTKEEWNVIARLRIGTYRVNVTGTLLDRNAEPLLYWTVGEMEHHLPVFTSPGPPLMAVSPCAPDVALIAQQDTHNYNIIYFTYTEDGFLTKGTMWYKLTASSLCSTGGIACSSIHLLDMALTNQHIILLTERGVFISNDLGQRNSQQRLIQWKMSYNMTSLGSLQAAKLGYTSLCHFAARPLKAFIMTLSYTLNNGESSVWYSNIPHQDWQQGMNTGNDGVLRIIYCLHNLHTRALTTLYEAQDHTFKVNVQKLSQNYTLYNGSYFSAYTFDSAMAVTGMLFTPDSYLLYVFGKKVWISEDGGNYFKIICHYHHDAHITKTSLSRWKDPIAMATSDGRILFGRVGVHRLIQLPGIQINDPKSLLYMNQHDDLFVITVNASSFTSLYINYTELTEAHADSSPHPLVLQYISAGEAIMFEFSSTGHFESSFAYYSVGQLIHQRTGGKAKIEEIKEYTGPTSGFLKQIKVAVTDPFTAIGSHESPALLCGLEVTSLNITSGAATLKLRASDDMTTGWHSDGREVTRTILIPGYPSFLLTEYVSNTTMHAVAPLVLSSLINASSGQWQMVDLGLKNGSSTWQIKEAECSYTRIYDSTILGQTLFELDVIDSINVPFSVKSIDENHKVGGIYLTLSEPWLMNVKSIYQESFHPHWPKYFVTVKNENMQEGEMALRFHIYDASLLCTETLYTVNIISRCPCTKKLVFVYPVNNITEEEFLHGNRIEDDQEILHTLEVNYRPPSIMGIAVPTSDNIYNADPSKPRPRNSFQISKRTGTLKQCNGKSNREACGCTKYMKLSADAKFSDCREKVYRMAHPARLVFKLALQQHGKNDVPVTSSSVVTVQEVNKRHVGITQGASTLLLESLQNDPLFVKLDQIYNAGSLTLSMNGSGLYHFHTEMVAGQSLCNLKAEFQLYVDKTPILYPLNYVLNISMSIFIGTLLFVIYLWYMAFHHLHVPRSLGEQCQELTDMLDIEGEHFNKLTEKLSVKA